MLDNYRGVPWPWVYPYWWKGKSHLSLNGWFGGTPPHISKQVMGIREKTREPLCRQMPGSCRPKIRLQVFPPSSATSWGAKKIVSWPDVSDMSLPSYIISLCVCAGVCVCAGACAGGWVCVCVYVFLLPTWTLGAYYPIVMWIWLKIRYNKMPTDSTHYSYSNSHFNSCVCVLSPNEPNKQQRCQCDRLRRSVSMSSTSPGSRNTLTKHLSSPSMSGTEAKEKHWSWKLSRVYSQIAS